MVWGKELRLAHRRYGGMLLWISSLCSLAEMTSLNQFTLSLFHRLT